MLSMRISIEFLILIWMNIKLALASVDFLPPAVPPDRLQ